MAHRKRSSNARWMRLRLRGNRFAVCLLIIGAGCGVARSQTAKEFLPPAPGQEWKLVWHDEFDGKKLDEAKWNRLGGWKRRDGYWMKEDAYLNGKGSLVLRASCSRSPSRMVREF